jgi:hypothetical protein
MTPFLQDLWSELARTPGWAWWMLVNAAIALWWICSQVPELEMRRRPRTGRALWLACVAIAFAVGGVLVAFFELVDRAEARWGGDDTDAEGL